MRDYCLWQLLIVIKDISRLILFPVCHFKIIMEQTLNFRVEFLNWNMHFSGLENRNNNILITKFFRPLAIKNFTRGVPLRDDLSIIILF